MADLKHATNEMKKRVRSMSEAELAKHVVKLTQDMAATKIKLASGEVKNVHEVKTLRRELAFTKLMLSQHMQESVKPETQESNNNYENTNR
ncbi:MAG: 50S ribosomal protein L29 [Patescibacteria group bacterium]|jgi:ribosomal protein L29